MLHARAPYRDKIGVALSIWCSLARSLDGRMDYQEGQAGIISTLGGHEPE